MKSNKTTTVAIGTILLASVAAIAMPLTAEAFGRGGGGGGGFHGGGGGGFHGFGGGGHFGGGGGFHGFGGGGHFGGGGFHGLGGGHFGGFRGVGGGHIGGFHGVGGHGIAGGNFHGVGGHGIAGGNFHGVGGHGIAGGNGHGVGGHGIAGNNIAGGGRFGNRGFAHGRGLTATRMAQGFGHNRFGHNRFGHNGDWHNGFWHNRGFGGDYYRYGGFGWIGPVFWPYAYSDLSCGIFWGYWGLGCGDPYWGVAFGDPFWGYGYTDIYDGLFSPFGFADLAPYLPSGPTSVRQARSRRAPPTNAVAQMCGDDSKEVADWPIDRIQQLVSPDEQQHMKLDNLAQASIKASQIIKSGCPTSVAFTPTGRLAAMEHRIETMQQAVDTVRGPLDAFYDSLTDEQKAKFNGTEQQNEPSREPAPGTVQSCSAANAATQWPAARIEAALRPNEEQETKLKALQNAAAEAAQQLASSCPSEMPATPPARLAAISKRLDVMLTAVKSVRGPLDNLYGDLSDEQKAQFNKIGQTHTAEK